MKKTIDAFIAILCLLLLAMPLGAQGTAAKLFHIGTVVGEENVPYYFYASPEETEAGKMGYYYTGTQLQLLEIGPEWCRFSLGFTGYIRTSHLSISQTPGEIKPIGFAFATFSPDDPAVQSTDNILFIPFLSDCNPNQTAGDPFSIGRPMRLIGYCGDMVQANRYGIDGFFQNKHVNILTYDNLFSQTQTIVHAGTYRIGDTLSAGLYHAASDGAGTAEIRIADNTGKMLTYTLENIASAAYTIYLPAGAAVTVSEHGVLASVPSAAAKNEPLYNGGRLLSGVDADLEWLSGWQYSIHAADTGEAYYILSTPWNDKMLEPGESFFLEPGETKDINLDAGESIELHNCRLEGYEE